MTESESPGRTEKLAHYLALGLLGLFYLKDVVVPIGVVVLMAGATVYSYLYMPELFEAIANFGILAVGIILGSALVAVLGVGAIVGIGYAISKSELAQKAVIKLREEDPHDV